MQKRQTTYYLYAFLMLFIMGCRGCSCNLPTTYVLSSFVEEIQVDSTNIARIKIEHLQKKGMGFTFNYKDHNSSSKYVVAYALQLNNRPYRDYIYEHNAGIIDSLESFRKDISIKLSTDNLHLLVSHKNSPVGVYHLLDDGMPFTISIEPNVVKTLANDFAQNKLQKPEDIMVTYISNPANNKDSYFNDYIKKTLEAQSNGSPLDFKLLDYIGLMLADSYYSALKIDYLADKNIDWRKKANDKVYKAISTVSRAKLPISNKIITDANGAIHLFANGLSNFMDKRVIERQVLPKYPLYPYTIELYKMEDYRTLHKNETPAIKKNCIQILSDDAFRKTLPQQESATNQAISFLINYRDEKQIEEFEQYIAAIFRVVIFNLRPPNIEADILYPYETRFSDAEQKIILDYARKLKAQLPKKVYFPALDTFFKNREMKKVIETVDTENNSES